MLKLYHNPRCSKSREAKQLLDEKGLKYVTIEYIKNPISIAELQEIIQKLSIEPIELVRQKEAIWKENYKGKDLSDDEILEAMFAGLISSDQALEQSANRTNYVLLRFMRHKKKTAVGK